MKRNKVAFLKPEEPAFIRKIKEKLRYQEGPDVDTKRQELSKSDEIDVNDREDEVPTVVLENSDVTKEEANSFIESQICTFRIKDN
ncbi:uncharacterized protein B4U80_10316 [Leptotrombidium deliense]|uniref:DUF4604 domain-containing protein n=1 Tax=Leptotrombidium deliense TaxID=299467 RepID=A0A443S3N6_9ACAR|nr:uncharacterized protein B4U80_10316 [Leptotrombidium deliense]